MRKKKTFASFYFILFFFHVLFDTKKILKMQNML